MSHYFSPSTATPLKTASRALEVSVAGVDLQITTGRGVFSKNEFDAGSRLLLQTFLDHDQTSTRVCDLGCGLGIIGCAIAQQRPHAQITLCDINRHATLLAAHNARANDIANAHIFCGDGLSAVRDRSFAAILCNPPIRAGNAVIQKLFDDAARCLQPQGALWIVVRTAQGAKSWKRKLEAQWGNCETIALQSGFRVMKSVAQNGAGG